MVDFDFDIKLFGKMSGYLFNQEILPRIGVDENKKPCQQKKNDEKNAAKNS